MILSHRGRDTCRNGKKLSAESFKAYSVGLFFIFPTFPPLQMLICFLVLLCCFTTQNSTKNRFCSVIAIAITRINAGPPLL